jgi:endonuclease/exonuclease/phosphatase family metal-dependent hydrolase
MRLAVALVVALTACRTFGADVAPLDATPLDAVVTETPRDPSHFRVATFNVHRYFDSTCDSGRCTSADFEAVPGAAAFAQRTTRLADAIARLDADAVCLQEIESERSLAALRDRLGATFATVVFGDIGVPGSLNVAVLARDARVEVHGHRSRALLRPDGTSTVFSREFLEVQVARGARRAVLFCAHFRSMVNDDPGRRLAEAEAAREIVVARARATPQALVVLAGDLNDTPGSPTLQALEAGGLLSRVAAELSASAQVTYVSRMVSAALDHLYVATTSQGAYVRGTVRVVRDDVLPLAGLGYGASDHAALRAEFTW